MFLAALVTGSALLALWLHVRVPRLAPAKLGPAIAHAVLALVALQFLPSAAASTAWALVVVFGLALPGLVYVFLASIWCLAAMQRLLPGSR
jgi:hypothetical protein